MDAAANGFFRIQGRPSWRASNRIFRQRNHPRQRWVTKLTKKSSSCNGRIAHQGLKVCIAFEGRDGAGKGGTIKAITEREMSQMYVPRYTGYRPSTIAPQTFTGRMANHGESAIPLNIPVGATTCAWGGALVQRG